MATVGQQLLAPESGWRRYDSASALIGYTGNWNTEANTQHYNGSIYWSNSNSTRVKFLFKGTELRLIGLLGVNKYNDIKVSIDGELYSTTQYSSNTITQGLFFEKLNLEDKIHSIEMYTDIVNTSLDYAFDAIDIDSDGELIRYDYFENTQLDESLRKYGVAWFGFDEASGNVTDKLGGSYVGTVTGATRVDGWNSEGKAMSFSGSNQYITVNNPVIPTEEKSIRFKIKTSVSTNSNTYRILDTSNSNASRGFTVYVYQGAIRINNRVSAGGNNILFSSNKLINDGKWHDVLFTWSGLKGDLAKLYIDDIVDPSNVIIADYSDVGGYSNLNIGRNMAGAEFLNGQIDDLQFFSKALSPSDFARKRVVIKTTDNKNLVLIEDKIRELPNLKEETLLKHGRVIREIDDAVDSEPFDLTKVISLYETINTDGTYNVTSIPTTTLKSLMGDSSELIYYTDSNKEHVSIESETELFSVYDYISETPEVIVYNESTDDIAVSTSTEPFNLYEEFNDELEVLYYTDDTSINNADLILDANWSPIDELDGDFEVVTWTDESKDTAKRVLGMTSIPKPQFIKLVNPKLIYGNIEDILAVDGSISYRDEVRYLISDNIGQNWYAWDKAASDFKIVATNTDYLISKNGMKFSDMNDLKNTDWQKWDKGYLNIGIFLKDNAQDTITSIVESLSYDDFIPLETTVVQDASLYILNTTASIDLTLLGNTVTGVLSDEDLTRVQYRVFLNGKPYFPTNGEFTDLEAPPTNINVTFASRDIAMGEPNTVRVEFQDFFGKTDYWQETFVGTYSGLMFKSTSGDYYSTEIGEVLKYLDFGIIMAGQTTLEHEIVLSNQYGYNINNITIEADTKDFPTGMLAELSKKSNPFTPESIIFISDTLKHGETLSFFIRLKTDLGATPAVNGMFRIKAKAEEVL